MVTSESSLVHQTASVHFAYVYRNQKVSHMTQNKHSTFYYHNKGSGTSFEKNSLSNESRTVATLKSYNNAGDVIFAIPLNSLLRQVLCCRPSILNVPDSIDCFLVRHYLESNRRIILFSLGSNVQFQQEKNALSEEEYICFQDYDTFR